jgi:predicted dehydrogenase
MTKRSTSNAPMGLAVVGAGNIAGPYLQSIALHPGLKLIGISDLDVARAKALAEGPGCRAYASLDEVLADPAVDTVINLTIHHAHYAVTHRCLSAGKHVHSEKPISLAVAEANRLVALAKKKGLRLSSAPSTLLGEAQQTFWKQLRAGVVGKPRVAYAEVNWGRIETWHPNPAPFYDVGPILDVAVYPLTILTAIFGPVQRVLADGGRLMERRKTKDGKPFRIGAPDFAVACLRHADGTLSRLTVNFYVAGNNTRVREGMEVHGDAGSIVLDSWTHPASTVRAGAFGQELANVPLVRPGPDHVEWARPVDDLADALRTKRRHRCTGDHAAHVLDVCRAIEKATDAGRAIALRSTFPRPAPMPWAV